MYAVAYSRDGKRFASGNIYVIALLCVVWVSMILRLLVYALVGLFDL